MIKILVNIWVFFAFFDVLSFIYLDRICVNFFKDFFKERKINKIFFDNSFFGVFTILPIALIPLVNCTFGICWFFDFETLLAKVCCKIGNKLLDSGILTSDDMEYLRNKISNYFNVNAIIKYIDPDDISKESEEDSDERN